jgi:hypothetical protein
MSLENIVKNLILDQTCNNCNYKFYKKYVKISNKEIRLTCEIEEKHKSLYGTCSKWEKINF